VKKIKLLEPIPYTPPVEETEETEEDQPEKPITLPSQERKNHPDDDDVVQMTIEF
jgi:hypothetical protein